MVNTIQDFYCDEVLSGKIVVRKVLETENVLAYYHTQPYWDVHIVIIPKVHISSLTSVNNFEMPILSEVIEVVKTIATRLEEQYRACTVMTNVGAYQSNKHMH